ncbi:E3 ubiquitin-protein ligase FANCL [Gracilariopsis chorda]|uniref:E3 ubiquitin-protein ligase FANCL n=1 Tax=Gracilariopsis chorda TaxID=448386 RepID=A0A2V3IQK7_9FLOR|nr:E3 ubiquitin-protein ligase FANCL [Gracilariopsis chorda]|eukprot:PXF44395.1 E3 ubiquitin-protein ligase FANCL [Gracilariopsis chorda]
MQRRLLTLQKLINDFPCVVPQDSNLTEYAGFLCVRQRQFRISVSSDCSIFHADKQLIHILGSDIDIVTERLKAAADPHDFLIELRDLIERAISKEDADRPLLKEADLPPAFYYEHLLSEIEALGWGRVESIDRTMRSLDLNITDSAQRKHTIQILLPVDYPREPPTCVASLPQEFTPKLGEHHILNDVLNQYGQFIERFQDFFRVMEDFDSNTCILEPEHPTWRDTYRRVCIGKHCSVRIEVDPRAPISGFPECRFLGSENAVAPFKQHLNQNIHKWDITGGTLPRENLQGVLELQFPSRESLMKDTEDVLLDECGICYSYRLDDRVPDIACDLKECSKPYHRACLVDWLRALPDTRESFGTISGNCVYCEHPIVVSMKPI